VDLLISEETLPEKMRLNSHLDLRVRYKSRCFKFMAFHQSLKRGKMHFLLDLKAAFSPTTV
jgi:hypothetical protein